MLGRIYDRDTFCQKCLHVIIGFGKAVTKLGGKCEGFWVEEVQGGYHE